MVGCRGRSGTPGSINCSKTVKRQAAHAEILARRYVSLNPCYAQVAGGRSTSRHGFVASAIEGKVAIGFCGNTLGCACILHSTTGSKSVSCIVGGEGIGAADLQGCAIGYGERSTCCRTIGGKGGEIQRTPSDGQITAHRHIPCQCFRTSIADRQVSIGLRKYCLGRAGINHGRTCSI